MWRSRARSVLGGLKPGRVLDVGCGEGSFLDAARSMNWEAMGTEISPEGCRLAKELWKTEPFNGPLEAAPFADASFDVVTLWHVIEHVPDPLKTLQTVVRLVRPGGRVVVACPNREDYLYRIAYWLGRGRSPHFYHPSDREPHVTYFTPRSLSLMLSRSGLEPCRFDVDRGHVQPVQNMLDHFATLFYRLTGKVWSQAMEIWANRPC
jgi:SAM-dependent methyltransferase